MLTTVSTLRALGSHRIELSHGYLPQSGQRQGIPRERRGLLLLLLRPAISNTHTFILHRRRRGLALVLTFPLPILAIANRGVRERRGAFPCLAGVLLFLPGLDSLFPYASTLPQSHHRPDKTR